MTEPAGLQRVVFDASSLLSEHRSILLASATLGYVIAYWSPWIVGEFVRKRTEWVAERAAKDHCDRAEMRRRLQQSRDRVNWVLQQISGILVTVDYSKAPPTDLPWLRDPDDLPIVQTALVAQADALVTENGKDVPIGETRNGVLIIDSAGFLSTLYARFPDAESTLQTYLSSTS